MEELNFLLHPCTQINENIADIFLVRTHRVQLRHNSIIFLILLMKNTPLKTDLQQELVIKRTRAARTCENFPF